jgi:hypothetical protein
LASAAPVSATFFVATPTPLPRKTVKDYSALIFRDQAAAAAVLMSSGKSDNEIARILIACELLPPILPPPNMKLKNDKEATWPYMVGNVLIDLNTKENKPRLIGIVKAMKKRDPSSLAAINDYNKDAKELLESLEKPGHGKKEASTRDIKKTTPQGGK